MSKRGILQQYVEDWAKKQGQNSANYAGSYVLGPDNKPNLYYRPSDSIIGIVLGGNASGQATYTSLSVGPDGKAILGDTYMPTAGQVAQSMGNDVYIMRQGKPSSVQTFDAAWAGGQQSPLANIGASANGTPEGYTGPVGTAPTVAGQAPVGAVTYYIKGPDGTITPYVKPTEGQAQPYLNSETGGLNPGYSVQGQQAYYASQAPAQTPPPTFTLGEQRTMAGTKTLGDQNLAIAKMSQSDKDEQMGVLQKVLAGKY